MLDQFQQRCLPTWYPEHHELHWDLLHPTLALAGEAGEFANLIKKHVYKPGFTASVDEMTEELGDILYYLAILCYQLNTTLEEVSKLNREKLRNGKHGWPEND